MFVAAHRKMKNSKAIVAGDGSVSKMLCKVEQPNSNTLMVGGKFLLYMNTRTRTRPYYFRKCKRVRPTTSIDSLPKELLFEILVRLPADYILERARFVCRRWSHIIHSDAFVKAQIMHSAYGLLLSRRGQGGGHPIFMTAAARGGRIETYELSHECRSRLITSSNGLAAELDWCRSTCDGTINIVNPVTKRSLLLPSLQAGTRLPVHRKCGIAFDASSSRYKTVIPYIKSSSFHLAIHTLGVDNSWRDVAVEHLFYDVKGLIYRGRPLITEGFMHWVSAGRACGLTMDVETEIVRVIQVPHPLCGRRSYYLSTGEFLSMLIGYGDYSWEILGMKPETGEWKKVLPDIKLVGAKLWLQLQELGSTEIDGQVLEPFGWVKYPEVLAFRYSGKSRACIFYNLDTHEISSIELPDSCANFIAFVHKNNLAWFA